MLCEYWTDKNRVDIGKIFKIHPEKSSVETNWKVVALIIWVF